MPIRRMRRPLAGALLLAASCAAMGQEHSYSPADIQAGADLYRANCLGCHGDEGAAVPGTDLSTGRFRHASSDEDLIRVIRNGIPDTPMAPHRHLSVGQARTLVAFLRSLSSGGGLAAEEETEVAVGNPARGRELFFGGAQCSTCHGVDGGGSLLSPDLAGIGARRSPASLQRAMLRPNAEIRPEHRFYRVVPADGREVLGLLMNQDTHSVQMLNAEEGLVSYLKADLREHGFIDSPMPTYQDLLNEAQVADLVAYMLSLNGEDSQ